MADLKNYGSEYPINACLRESQLLQFLGQIIIFFLLQYLPLCF